MCMLGKCWYDILFETAKIYFQFTGKVSTSSYTTVKAVYVAQGGWKYWYLPLGRVPTLSTTLRDIHSFNVCTR